MYNWCSEQALSCVWMIFFMHPIRGFILSFIHSFVQQRPERARQGGGHVKATTAAYPTGLAVTEKMTAEITRTRRRKTARCATRLGTSPARTGAASHGDGCVTLMMTAGITPMRLLSSAVSEIFRLEILVLFQFYFSIYQLPFPSICPSVSWAFLQPPRFEGKGCTIFLWGEGGQVTLKKNS